MEVNLPSQQPNPSGMPSASHSRSMRVVYGSAIIVLSIILTGMICFIGGVQIPYVSSFYNPVVEPTLIPQTIRFGTHGAPSSLSKANLDTGSTTASSTVSSKKKP